MHAIAHLVRAQRLADRSAELGPRHTDVERDGLGTLEESVEVLVEERRVPLVHAQPLPDAVAEHEAGVEHRHDGLGPRLQLAVDVDQHGVVARVVVVLVRARVPS